MDCKLYIKKKKRESGCMARKRGHGCCHDRLGGHVGLKEMRVLLVF